jgi:hypothetical protein
MRQEKRKRGAQPGNWNALKHGLRSVRKRAERRAKFQPAFDERRARERAWMQANPGTIDYAAICDAIAADKARRAGGLH